MTVGIATLSLEPVSKVTRRSKSSTCCFSLLREFLLGPENALIEQGIGLSITDGLPTISFQHHPLLITAPAGYGKTQLLHALAATWSRQNPQDQVSIVTASDLVHAYLDALKLDDVPHFQQRFRRADLLLIDNLDEINDSHGTQHQLSVIVDHRQRFGRPTVLASRQPLHALKVSTRLHSRLSSGLTLPLHLPSKETRRELLDRLCHQRSIDFTDDARELLANQPQITLPQMMGLVNLMCSSDFDQSVSVGLDQVETLLEANSDPLDPRKIIRVTARHFGLKVGNVTGASRRKMDALARSVAMFLIRELTVLSYQQIGQLFHHRDHTTVMHACKKIRRIVESDSSTRSAIQELERVLSPHALSSEFTLT